MRYSAVVAVKKSAKISYRGLLGKMIGQKKGKIKIEETKETIKVTITADDISSFRAAFNSITKDISVIESVSKI